MLLRCELDCSLRSAGRSFLAEYLVRIWLPSILQLTAWKTKNCIIKAIFVITVHVCTILDFFSVQLCFLVFIFCFYGDFVFRDGIFFLFRYSGILIVKGDCCFYQQQFIFPSKALLWGLAASSHTYTEQTQ